MRKVWKYTLDLANGVEHILEIPGWGRFLSAKDIPTNPGLGPDPVMPKLDTWWEVDTDEPVQLVRLQMIGTGFELPDNAIYYLATFFPVPGVVFHLWRLSDE